MHASYQKLNLIKNKVNEIISKKQLKSNPKIIVVTKTFPLKKILPIIENGHSHFGENKIQEAENKWIDIKIANTMRDIDRQSEEIKKIWEEEDKPKTIITTTPSEVKGLDDMEIKYDGGS